MLNLVLDSNPISVIWSGNNSQSIPFPLGGEYWVRSSQGRDGAYAVQTENGFLFGSVDNPNGADTYAYEFHRYPLDNSPEWMKINANGGLPFGHLNISGKTGFQNNIASGTVMEFSATIDGSEEFIFSNDVLTIRHLSWSKATNPVIDGLSVPLTWTDNYSQEISLDLPDNFNLFKAMGEEPYTQSKLQRVFYCLLQMNIMGRIFTLGK